VSCCVHAGGRGRGRSSGGGRGQQGRGSTTTTAATPTAPWTGSPNDPNAPSLAYGAMNYGLPGAGGGGHVDPNAYHGAAIVGLPPSATVNAMFANLYQ
jgi:hypothetical protein